MIHSLAFALLAVLPFAQSSQLDRSRIDAAVSELEAAFKGNDSQARVTAIQKSAEVIDARIIELVEQGLTDKDTNVRKAAIEVLGRNPHKDALDALQASFKRDKALYEKDPTLLPLLLKAIARHGSPSSIDILTKDPFSQRTDAAIKARVLGLANIRSKKSLEALFDMMEKVGLRKLDTFALEFQIAILRLTGENLGRRPEEWQQWWSANHRRIEITAQARPMPGFMQTYWDDYWGDDRARRARRLDK
jgi:hypothetical protein